MVGTQRGPLNTPGRDLGIFHFLLVFNILLNILKLLLKRVKHGHADKTFQEGNPSESQGSDKVIQSFLDWVILIKEVRNKRKSVSNDHQCCIYKIDTSDPI